MAAMSPKHELSKGCCSSSKNDAFDFGSIDQVVESTKMEILDSDDSSAATTVAPQDEEDATASLSKSSHEHFMDAYNAMFGGDDADVPVGSETTQPAQKSTTTGHTWSFSSMPKGSSSLPFMDSGEAKTGYSTLDATLTGTSLDFGVSRSLRMPDTVGSMDEVPITTDASNDESTRVTPPPATVVSAAEPDATTPIDSTAIKDVTPPPVVSVKTRAAKALLSKAATARTKTTRSSRPKKKKGPKGDYLDSEPTKLDVLLGRGGLTNHWAGNKRYLDEVHKLQEWYKVSSKNEKTDLSQALVNYVQTYGGRFVEKDEKTKCWYVVSNLVARRKASQALREYKTQEEREILKAARKQARLAATN